MAIPDTMTGELVVQNQRKCSSSDSPGMGVYAESARAGRKKESSWWGHLFHLRLEMILPYPFSGNMTQREN